MIRLLLAALVSLVTSIGLTGCVTDVDLSCHQTPAGEWVCAGGVGGLPPTDSPK